MLVISRTIQVWRTESAENNTQTLPTSLPVAPFLSEESPRPGLAEKWEEAGSERREEGGLEEEAVCGPRDHGILQTRNHAKYFMKSSM